MFPHSILNLYMTYKRFKLLNSKALEFHIHYLKYEIEVNEIIQFYYNLMFNLKLLIMEKELFCAPL